MKSKSFLYLLLAASASSDNIEHHQHSFVCGTQLPENPTGKGEWLLTVELEVRAPRLACLFALPLIVLLYRVFPVLLPFDVVAALLRVSLETQGLSELALAFHPRGLTGCDLGLGTLFYDLPAVLQRR